MDGKPTYYETLGLKPTAVIDEIRLAHRKLAQQNHPDKVHHLVIEFPWVEQEAAHRFELITEAFNVLSDDVARTRYDAELRKRWPDFVSRCAPPVYDPIEVPLQHSRPEPEAHEKSGNAQTGPVEFDEPEFVAPPDSYFQSHPISRASQFRGFEPRAENNRRNVFLGTFALIALAAVIYITSSSQLLDQSPSNWPEQQKQITKPDPTFTPASPAAAPQSQ